jgi:hypothetical protein
VQQNVFVSDFPAQFWVSLKQIPEGFLSFTDMLTCVPALNHFTILLALVWSTVWLLLCICVSLHIYITETAGPLVMKYGIMTPSRSGFRREACR